MDFSGDGAINLEEVGGISLSPRSLWGQDFRARVGMLEDKAGEPLRAFSPVVRACLTGIARTEGFSSGGSP